MARALAVEQSELHRPERIARKIADAAVAGVDFLDGRSPSAWMRLLAVELTMWAERRDAQPSLDDQSDAPDVIANLIRQATRPSQLSRIKEGYAHRWTARHDELARQRRATWEARW